MHSFQYPIFQYFHSRTIRTNNLYYWILLHCFPSYTFHKILFTGTITCHKSKHKKSQIQEGLHDGDRSMGSLPSGRGLVYLVYPASDYNCWWMEALSLVSTITRPFTLLGYLQSRRGNFSSAFFDNRCKNANVPLCPLVFQVRLE